MDRQIKKDQRLGKIYFLLFVLLVIGGIVQKRVFLGPEYMMLWHLPAAVFLVMSGKLVMKASRMRYSESIKRHTLAKMRSLPHEK